MYRLLPYREEGSPPILRPTVDVRLEHGDTGDWMPFQGLLGTEGLLDKFAVTFNKYYDYFVLERPDDFHDRIGAPLADDPLTALDPQWERPGD